MFDRESLLVYWCRVMDGVCINHSHVAGTVHSSSGRQARGHIQNILYSCNASSLFVLDYPLCYMIATMDNKMFM